MDDTTKTKSEITIRAITGLGNKFEDLLEAAKLEISRLEGMKSAISHVNKMLENQSSAADSEHSQGQVGLDAKEYAKKHLGKCLSMLKNNLTQVDASTQVAKGKVSALETVIKESHQVVQAEQRKLDAYEDSLINDNGEFAGPAYRRPAGIRPSDPMADRRSDPGAVKDANTPSANVPGEISPESTPAISNNETKVKPKKSKKKV